MWLVSSTWPYIGAALQYRCDLDETRDLKLEGNGPSRLSFRCVAAMNDTVFFGGDCGLYKLDNNGKLLKHYDPKQAPMPGGEIYDVCQGDGKIYFVFQASPHRGVAVLDPKSERIAVLAPSSRDANSQSEPQGVCRLRWDAATPRLYAFGYTYWYFALRIGPVSISWSPTNRKWQLHPIKRAPLLVVSEGDETLSVKVSGDRSQFHFVKADQDVTADVPLPWMMGEPAWDEHRIWIPTASGLYEVDRATGHVRWLAYQIDVPTASGPYAADFAVGRVPWATYPNGPLFFSVLRHGNRLYVATSRGLYYREIVPMPTSKITSAPSPAMQPPSQSALAAVELTPEQNKTETPMSVSRSLQGDWVVVEMGDKGYKATPQELQGMRWLIKGDIITATDPDGSTGKMRYKIDPNESPRHFDITSLQGKLKGTTDPGIYELREGQLLICFREPDNSIGKRPKAFTDAARVGSGYGTITLEKKGD